MDLSDTRDMSYKKLINKKKKNYFSTFFSTHFLWLGHEENATPLLNSRNIHFIHSLYFYVFLVYLY